MLEVWLRPFLLWITLIQLQTVYIKVACLALCLPYTESPGAFYLYI